MIYGSVGLKVIIERRQGNNLSTVSHSQISTSIMLNRLCCPPSLSCFMYKCEERMRSFMILVYLVFQYLPPLSVLLKATRRSLQLKRCTQYREEHENTVTEYLSDEYASRGTYKHLALSQSVVTIITCKLWQNKRIYKSLEKRMTFC